MNIANYDELMRIVNGVASEDLKVEEIVFSDKLIFRLKLKGEKWDGLVDYEVANFVLSIQSTIDDIYKQLSYDDPRYKRIPKEIHDSIKVKVKIEYGCSLFDIKLGSVFNSLLKNMTGKEKIFLLSTICGLVCGTFLGLSYMDNQAEIAKIKELHKDNREVVKVLDKAIQYLEPSYKALDSLTKSMDKNDKIEFQTSNKTYHKHEVRKLIRPLNKPQAVKSSYNVDGRCEVLRIYKDSDEVSIIIDKYSLLASTAPLMDKGKAEIHDIFKEAHLQHKPALVDLQVVISVENKELRGSYVVGVGKPRAESYSVTEVLATQPNIKPDDLPLVKWTKK